MSTSPVLHENAAPVVSPVVSPAVPTTPPSAPPAEVWWVRKTGSPMVRHTRHKSRLTKTACKLSLGRYREATDAEIADLPICNLCVPVTAPKPKKKSRR